MKPVTTLTVSAAAFVVSLLAASPAVGEEPLLTASRPPSALERARMESWHRTWIEEGAPADRSFRALHRAAAGETPVALRPHCLALAEDLLELDRRRVLPVPDPATDLHFRRGLRELTQAAVACLGKRPYATRQALSEAERAFREADLLLKSFGLELQPASGAWPAGSGREGSGTGGGDGG